MIVFKNNTAVFKTEEWINRIRNSLESLLHWQFDHDIVVKLLIDCGELECAVTDSFCPEDDSLTDTVLLLRKMTIQAGRIFFLSWKKRPIDTYLIFELQSVLESIRNLRLPGAINFGVSEGFAFYGLFPETYLETAQKYYQRYPESQLTIIGLRTIGTTLSAIVSATLTFLGCENISFTVRPRGEPFNRKVRTTKKLEDVIKTRMNGNFIITDEGPGLSGSSFGGTAHLLTSLGVLDKNIMYFPSWEPDSSMLNSINAREHWVRHQKFSTSFESAWIDSKKLHKRFNAHSFIDISAGMWRNHFAAENLESPPVHPHHERRKYLIIKDHAEDNPSSLIKFAGLGRYGEKACQRADLLASSGYSLPVKKCSNGFIEYELIDGTSRFIKEISKPFLLSAASYVAFLKKTFPDCDVVSPEKMIEMIKVNITESIGEEYLKKNTFQKYINDQYLKYGTAIDGKMQLHKWLVHNNKFIKTDHTDHYNDQFFPGCQDIAWDLAGGIIEWNLNYTNEIYFINEYLEKSGDVLIRKRILANKIAYCAFRVGVSKLFSESLSGTPDGDRFVKQYRYYREHLLNILK
jgi:hypothetical protein